MNIINATIPELKVLNCRQMVCFMGYLSEAGDEHSTAQQFQDAFMLLKRSKRLLTSAFPDTGKGPIPKTDCRFNTEMMAKRKVNQHRQAVYYHSVSVTTNICWKTSEQLWDTLNKPIIPLKQNVLKSMKTTVQSRWHDMNPRTGALPENLGCFGLREPQRCTVSLR